jgi:hypothetical protein
MRNRQLESLNDALAREIEQALGVEPSPEFQARIRQRVAREPLLAADVWWRSITMPAAALAVIVAAILAGWQLMQPDTRRDAAQTVAGDQGPLPAVATAVEERAAREGVGSTTEFHDATATAVRVAGEPADIASQPVEGSGALRLPPVIVADDEREGMRALIALAQAGRFQMLVVSETTAAEPPAATAPSTEGVAVQTPAQIASSTAEAPAPADDADRSDRVTDGEDPATAPPLPKMAVLTVRPIVIEPVTITPLVPPPPDEGSEGAAE